MRLPRFRLRTLMLSMILLGILLTFVVEAISRQRAAVRFRRLRARHAKVDSEAAWAQAIDDSHRFGSSPQNQRSWAEAMKYEQNRVSVQPPPR
jgi:hypothetical protein